MTKKIAVILIRGLVGARQEVKDTLKMLNLQKKNTLALVDDTPVYQGMLKKVQNYVTYGPVSEETIKALKEKKKGKYYPLHPPRGGFERKGIKVLHSNGGALGPREEMDSLIQKMI